MYADDDKEGTATLTLHHVPAASSVMVKRLGSKMGSYTDRFMTSSRIYIHNFKQFSSADGTTLISLLRKHQTRALIGQRDP
jgi:hypothetical protein